MVGEQQQILTFRLFCSKPKTIYFTPACFLCRYIIRNLYGLYDLISFADHEITFSRAFVQIIYVQTRQLAKSVKMYGDLTDGLSFLAKKTYKNIKTQLKSCIFQK